MLPVDAEINGMEEIRPNKNQPRSALVADPAQARTRILPDNSTFHGKLPSYWQRNAKQSISQPRSLRDGRMAR